MRIALHDAKANLQYPQEMPIISIVIVLMHENFEQNTLIPLGIFYTISMVLFIYVNNEILKQLVLRTHQFFYLFLY